MNRIGLALNIILTYFVLGGQLVPQPALANGSTGLVMIESNENGLTLSWTSPDYGVTTIEMGDSWYSQVRMSELTLSARPGYPQLPFYSRLIGLPAIGGARVKVIEVNQETIQLPYPPLPAPLPQPIRFSSIDPQFLPGGGATTLAPDTIGYASNAFYPAEIAQVGSPEQVRDRRVASFIINPVRVNPVTGQAKIVHSLRLEITFEHPAEPSLTGQGAPDAFAQALASSLVNPEAAQWQIAPAPPTELDQQAVTTSSTANLTKVIIVEAGLYALTYADLLGAGLPVDTLDPRTLQLSHGQTGPEVAIYVEGEADGAFDPDDRLLFYAEPEFSRFTDEDVYLLSFGQTNGLRMATRSGDPGSLPAGSAWHTAQAEINSYYDPLYAGRDGDRWYWDDLRRPDKASATYNIQIDTPLTTGPEATLTVWLQGYTDPAQNPDHRVVVSVNGIPVGETTWDGKRALEASFTVPAPSLHSGQNQVSLSLPGLSGVGVEGVWLDALSLTYASTAQGGTDQVRFEGEAGPKSYTLAGWSSFDLSVYEITEADAPRRVLSYSMVTAGSSYTLTVGDADTSPATYLVVPDNQVKTPLALEAATLQSDPPDGADYIIITHSDFAGAVAPLAAHRAKDGLRAVVVDVQSIYDTYSAGRLTPEAIRTFIEHAYNNWTPPTPLYVLLVGDGSYDFKNHSGWNPQTFIPPYLADVDPWWGETASDNRFVTFTGSDPLPDLFIGRLAVTSPVEAQTVVDKIIRYEADPVPGGWNARHLFVSDNPDFAGNFHASSDQAYNKLVDPFTGSRFYYSDTAGNQSHIYTNVEMLRTALLANLNQGASLVTFHGHSSWHQWAVEGLFQWSLDPALNDVIRLNNGYRLPVVLEMTCFTGFFHHPRYPTMDESLLRKAGGGAVAVWGGTGLGVGTGHDTLQTGFYRTIVDQGETKLGAAIVAGKMELYGTGFHHDLLDTFTLFGDPALNLNFTLTPFDSQVYLPMVIKGA